MPTTDASARSPRPEPRQRTRLLAVALRFLRLVAIVLLGFLIVMYFLQERMIFPGTSTQGRPEAKVATPPDCQLLQLSSTLDEPVTALFGPALQPDGRPHPDPSSRPALIYFYGNAMCLAFCGPEFERFRRLGLNVIIPDYLGYGLSGGKTSEDACRRTADACLLWVRDRGFPVDRIIVGGWSLGGAVAIDLVFRRPVGGLFAFSTFTSTHDMALWICPLPLPRWFFAHKFDSLAKLPQIKCPILLGHGRRDRLVPFAMHDRLAAAVTSPLSTFVVEGAEHNDFYDVGGRQIDEAIRTFVEQRISRN